MTNILLQDLKKKTSKSESKSECKQIRYEINTQIEMRADRFDRIDRIRLYGQLWRLISSQTVSHYRLKCLKTSGDTVSWRLISQKRVASYHQATLRRYRRNIAEAINLSCSQDDAVSRRFCSPVRVMIRGTRDNPPLLRVLLATLYGLVTSIQRIDDPEILAGM